MEISEFQALLTAAFHDNGLNEPNNAKAEQFYRLTEHLISVNQQTNLTAIRDISGIVYKHYVDSCLASGSIPLNSSLLDVGCGAGFPCLPLSIIRPDLSITALDSTVKKIRFVRSAADLIGSTRLKTVSGRAEDPSVISELGTFNAVTSRAVARLNVLCELCLHFVKIGGVMVAMKGPDGEREVLEAQRAIKALGGEVSEVRKYQLLLPNGESEGRSLIKIQKVTATPAAYPRAYAAILKKPL